ncbi:MAG: T9SS type A sorting domain-containing protein [Bacteroidales bacterium]|nr:T9SS type A sorting domain-containing protein [Bacteroidales bacterium]
MKRLVASLIIYFAFSAVLFGQCEPNMVYTRPGIYPDSATGFPPAVATYEYNLVITAVIPADTILFPLPLLPIDSIGVYEISGLPEGFQAIPNRPSGYWPGGTSGCMLITGTATQAQLGNYPLTIKAVGYMGGFGIPYTYEITYYSILVLDSLAFGIPDLPENGNIRMQAFPNPFVKYVNVDFYADLPGTYEFRLFDATGRLMISKETKTKRGENNLRIDGSNLKQGIYYCVLQHSEGNIRSAFKLIKQ